MLGNEREVYYVLQREGGELTPAQRRRVGQKEGSRKTHEHARILDEDGTERKVRCTRCRPETRVPTPVKAAPGPRDWTPDQ